jgi:inorganic pyrophosphatase
MGLHERVRIFVENEAGSDLRHSYDEASFKLLRTRQVAAAYPYPYGFILDTTAEDGGAVDCFVLTTSPIPTASALEGEPVGLLEQCEDGEVDHKILVALPVALPGSAPHLDPNLH